MSTPLIIGVVALVTLLAALVVWREPVLAAAQRSQGFLREVRAELRKVSWPTWEDLRRSTMIITVIVIIIGIVIGVMDFLFSKILIDFFGRVFG